MFQNKQCIKKQATKNICKIPSYQDLSQKMVSGGNELSVPSPASANQINQHLWLCFVTYVRQMPTYFPIGQEEHAFG